MKIVLDISVIPEADKEFVAETLFNWLCDGGDTSFPEEIESFDNFEVVG